MSGVLLHFLPARHDHGVSELLPVGATCSQFGSDQPGESRLEEAKLKC